MPPTDHPSSPSSVPPLPRGRASLEVLRAEAAEERDTVVHERLLAGEDPWAFMEELPTVDELVVWLLRADAIRANDGRLPGRVREYRVLRQIALEHPPLTPTVWRLLGPLTAETVGPGQPSMNQGG